SCGRVMSRFVMMIELPLERNSPRKRERQLPQSMTGASFLPASGGPQHAEQVAQSRPVLQIILKKDVRLQRTIAGGGGTGRISSIHPIAPRQLTLIGKRAIRIEDDFGHRWQRRRSAASGESRSLSPSALFSLTCATYFPALPRKRSESMRLSLTT